MGAVLLIVGIIFVFLAIKNRDSMKEMNESRIQKRMNAKNDLNDSICQLARAKLGTEKESMAKTLDRLHDAAKQTEIENKNAYLKSNNIQTVYDSHSDLGVCGISYDVLFTQIEWIGGDLEYMLSQGSVSKEYTELIKYYDEEINFNQNGGGLASKDCSDLIAPLQMLVNDMVDLYREVFDDPQFDSEKIDLNDIQYFKVEGTVHYVSNVSGGGVNLHGAAAGAILAGGAAAVIGSQIGTETTTRIIEKDDRKIIFVYMQNGVLRSIDIRSTDVDRTIDVLRKLIPQKEESVVMLSEKQNSHNIVRSQPSSAEELKKFKELLDMGVITQEEFDAKKKQLLGL